MMEVFCKRLTQSVKLHSWTEVTTNDKIRSDILMIDIIVSRTFFKQNDKVNVDRILKICQGVCRESRFSGGKWRYLSALYSSLTGFFESISSIP